MSGQVLHQLLAGAAPGDAVTDQAFAIRRWLRSQGLRSDLYAESVHPALKDEVQYHNRLTGAAAGERLIYHYSIGSETIDQVQGLGARLLVIYHNVTPPETVAGVDPRLAAQLAAGRARLGELAPFTDLAVGDSAYNETDLAAAGYGRTGVLPIVLDDGPLAVAPSAEVLARLADGRVHLLTVGRLAPHKCQDDAIKVLYYCRAGGLNVHLHIVGSDWLGAYRQWLDDLAESLGVGEHVSFAGHVTQAELNAYYQACSVYLTLSEHEGFCKPLIESMHFRLPVVAYSTPAVAETLGPAGILVRRKDFAAIAELVGLVATDGDLRHRLTQSGTLRALQYAYSRVMEQLHRHLVAAGWLQT
ncbi:MAG: glycosyltransferase [Anaerolineae bacterium]